jgi:hypothetical protein
VVTVEEAYIHRSWYIPKLEPGEGGDFFHVTADRREAAAAADPLMRRGRLRRREVDQDARLGGRAT